MSKPFDIAAVRAEFPALALSVHGKPLTYLDSGASSHKPLAVLDAMDTFYRRDYANVHRAVHTLSQRATAAYEHARSVMARFVGGRPDHEVIFTKGTTEGINLVANAWGRTHLGPDDEVVLSQLEHHSNIVPWQMVCQATRARIVVLDIDSTGQIADGEVVRKIGPRTKVVALAHTSNVLGTVNPIAAISAHVRAHAAPGAIVVVDGAQAVPHGAIDVAALGADFFACSAHKMYGPTGVGILWGRAEVLAAMPPWQGGGDMIRSVSFGETTYADPPARFEAGTPPIAETVGMAAAAEWLMAFDPAAILAHEADLVAYGTDLLGRVKGLTLYGTAPHKRPIFSFALAGCHPHDLGTLLDLDGVAVRVGHHCAEPLMVRLGVSATTRASAVIYTSREDFERLALGLEKARGLLT